jgi:hypothetical protein
MPTQPDEVGLGLPAGCVVLVGCGEPTRVGVGEVWVGVGLGDVGEAAGWVGDGLVGVGEGLACGVVRVGLGVGVAVGVEFGDDPVVLSEVDPLVLGTGRTTR